MQHFRTPPITYDGEHTMGRPKRSEQFDPNEVQYAHITQRCVRQAFMMGIDPVTKVDCSGRREWVRRRAEVLSSVFAIDMLSYSVLSNHLHLTIRTRPDISKLCSDEEVATRWLQIYPGKRIEEFLLAEPTEAQVKALLSQPEKMTTIRKRLSDISWYMKALSEPIARRAN